MKITIKKVIALLVVWQLISVGLMAVGTWPPQVAIINTAILALFVVVAKPYYGTLLLILSIPFYVALPNTTIPDLPMWRPLFLWLFIVWLGHLLIDQRQWLLRAFTFKRWSSEQPLTGAKFKKVILNSLQRIDSRFMAWDKVAVLFIVLATLSLLIARFPGHGLKQILFLLNIYLFYVVVINVTTDAQKVKEVIRYTTYSLGIIVALGFVQYISTMFANPYYFWQYWAVTVSSLYYGTPLGSVLAYSNSWFSYSGGSQSLRMFGVLPDTHAFGVICIFFIAFLIPNLNITEAGQSWKKLWGAVKSTRWYVLAALGLGMFGIMANGTRGVWLAMLAPLFIALALLIKKIVPQFSRTFTAMFAVVIVLFVLSPFISKGLNLIRTFDTDDDFLNRASSIYDLNESSNAGRLEIWKSSVQFATVHPFGVGYGNFITSIVKNIPRDAKYENVSAKKNLKYNLPQKFITAHSLYLQLLVELGFAGLLAFMLFWWEYFERLIGFLKKHSSSVDKYVFLVFSLAMAFIWILAYGVFDLTILNDRVMQYLLLSLAISGLIFAKFDSFASEGEKASEEIVTPFEPGSETKVI